MNVLILWIILFTFVLDMCVNGKYKQIQIDIVDKCLYTNHYTCSTLNFFVFILYANGIVEISEKSCTCIVYIYLINTIKGLPS